MRVYKDKQYLIFDYEDGLMWFDEDITECRH